MGTRWEQECGDSRPRLSAGQSPAVLPAAPVQMLSKESMTNSNLKTNRSRSSSKLAQTLLLCAAVFALLGAGDPATRFNQIGHQMMCMCSCGQILLECNHVGCTYSDGMRNELTAAVFRGDSDSLVEQSFVQKYGPTVLAAPTTKGFDRAAYIIPPVFLILGFGLVVLIVIAWKNRPTPAIADGLRPARGAELDQFRNQAGKETDL
jgi:cytochrome c-type biogenesis protein CcmH